MAQLSLFDTTPPEPKVPRPPGRNKKVVEVDEGVKVVDGVSVVDGVGVVDGKKLENADKATHDVASSVEEKNNTEEKQVPSEVVARQEAPAQSVSVSSGIHFEPAPIYTDELPASKEIENSNAPAYTDTTIIPSLVLDGSAPDNTIETVQTDTASIELPSNNEPIDFSEEPVVVQNEEPVVVHSEKPVVVHNEEPVVVHSEEPVVVHNEEPVVVRNEEPVVVRNEEPVVPKHSTSDSALNQNPTHSLNEEEVPYAASSEEPHTKIDTTQLSKQYYSISEVSAMFNVNASHLRYWEKEFPAQLGKVRKNGKGDRFYTPKNIEQLQVLFYLVKSKKMTLGGARDYLKQKKRGAKSNLDAITLLQQVRGFLVELKKELNQ